MPERVRIALVTIASIALLVLGIVAWVNWPQPVNAAEVLAHAEQTANGVSGFGLQSYQGGVVGQGRLMVNMPLVKVQGQVWSLLPDNLRIEMRITGLVTQATNQPAPGSSPINELVTFVTDGNTAWLYYPTEQRIEQVDPRMFDGSDSVFGTTNLPTLLKNASRDYAVKLIGTETVIGRSTYVLELRPKLETQAVLQIGKVQAWIDQQYFLQLRGEVRDTQGNILYNWAFVDLQLNPALSASLFKFQPPPGVPIVDRRQSLTLGVTESAQSWRQSREYAWQLVAKQAHFSVFMPHYVPAGFEPGWPSYDVQTGAVVQNYTSKIDSSVMLIIEKPASVVQGPIPGQPVQIAALTIRYWEWEGKRWLFLERDGTHVELQASFQVSKDALLQIAASMRPVPVR